MPDRTFKINFPYFILILLFSSIHILPHCTYKGKKISSIFMNSMKAGCCGGGEDRGEILCSTFSSKRLYLFIAIWRIWKNGKKLVFIKLHLGDLKQNLSDCFPVTKLRNHMPQMTGLLSSSWNLKLLKY